MSASFYVFGYGSLIFAPQRDHALIRMLPAELPGLRRSFNKRSRTRSCASEQSYGAFESPDGFLRQGLYQSLVLGTVGDRRGALRGALLEYPDHHRSQVLAELDRREGFDAGRASRLNGYLRAERVARRLDSGAEQSCVIYLSNPDPACVYHVPPSLSVLDRARILVNATPRTTSEGAAKDDSRGLLYLEGVRRGLKGIGIVDDDLERLAATIRGQPGPWVDRVAPLAGAVDDASRQT